MKAREVMEILRISRSTLRNLRKEGILKAERLPNGHYEFDPESVYKYLLEKSGKSVERKTVIYARVSTPKQKQDLINQIEVAKNFCIARGWKIDGVYKDIASALNFDKRKDFHLLLNEILSYRIAKVVITFKDRLMRTGFNFFENLFKRYGTEIVVINNYTNEKNDTEEIIEEIITLLHSFSMKFYSNRRKIRKVLEDAIK
ncbi:Resolvase domain [Desulfurobacterium thermolithotrophum DSM 11699]|uniref:Resolvase domain n=1 Tax=Desulfurobacterium thermolithotrophum (strain DSM 11699 / BSA) TaxID=868864 RepID=F0S2R3_DESTD|nr:IS607 family transposase [Desulfurobacterium thermolithotrophum]ADY73135.1 Resolvase domain [Desulfurobacterium thermolithotrophum DSM 11699]ADY73331.1 Resolvase domain [Desulfurobacterium thermolithotrophum DSM 11699]